MSTVPSYETTALVGGQDGTLFNDIYVFKGDGKLDRHRGSFARSTDSVVHLGNFLISDAGMCKYPAHTSLMLMATTQPRTKSTPRTPSTRSSCIMAGWYYATILESSSASSHLRLVLCRSMASRSRTSCPMVAPRPSSTAPRHPSPPQRLPSTVRVCSSE